jgi:hypothetical protein
MERRVRPMVAFSFSSSGHYAFEPFAKRFPIGARAPRLGTIYIHINAEAEHISKVFGSTRPGIAFRPIALRSGLRPLCEDEEKPMTGAGGLVILHVTWWAAQAQEAGRWCIESKASS